MFRIFWELANGSLLVTSLDDEDEKEEKSNEDIVSKTGWGFLISDDDKESSDLV